MNAMNAVNAKSAMNAVQGTRTATARSCAATTGETPARRYGEIVFRSREKEVGLQGELRAHSERIRRGCPEPVLRVLRFLRFSGFEGVAMERGERFGPALVDLSELTVAEAALRRSREKNRRVVLRIQLQQSEQRTNHLPRVERTLVQLQEAARAVRCDAAARCDEVEEMADVGERVFVIELEKED